MKKVAAVDPGLDGFFCTLTEEGSITTTQMPVLYTGKGKKRSYDVQGIVNIFLDFKKQNIDLVVIEKQQSMPGQGVASSFTIGFGFGILEMACAALQIPYTIVHPRTWKGVMCKDIAGEPKAKSIIATKRLFPTVDLKKTARCTTEHDGKADALLLAWYGLHKVLGVE